MRVLITGVTGFAGSRLAEFLVQKGGFEVFGTCRTASAKDLIHNVEKKLRLLTCDLKDAEGVRKAVETARADWIFHLAAQSSVPASWKNPEETLLTNVRGQIHLLEAVKKTGAKPRVHIASSSEVYGKIDGNSNPVTEECPLRPLTPYGVSKVAQDLMGYQYFAGHGIPVVVTRAFFHIGPGQREDFVASNFAKQVAAAEAGRQEPVIRVGNLTGVRDFTDVRDVVRAYVLALEKGESGTVYNICSGKGRAIREILDYLVSQSRVKLRVEEDPERMRPLELPVLIGDGSRFYQRTGWKPEIAFEKTLSDLLEDWRKKIGAPAASKKT